MTAIEQHMTGNVVARHLLRWQLKDMGWLFAMYLLTVVLVGVAIHVLAGVTGSIWDGALQIPRWFSLGMGVYLAAFYLPAYVAHGRTRREAAVGSALFAVSYAVYVGALLTLGFAIESGLYHLLGWSALLPDPHPLGSVAAAAGTLGVQTALLLVYLAAGALCAAAFYRAPGLGTLTLPVAVVLLLLSEAVTGRSSLGPIPLPETLAAAAAVGSLTALLAALVAFALTWPIVRDIPLRPKSG